MTDFLDDTATLLENQQSLSITVQNEYAQHSQGGAAGGVGNGSAKHFACGVCQSLDHEAKDCGDFYPLILGDRIEVAKRNNMCFVCLKRGHHTKKCFSPHRCDEPVCRNKDFRHHPLLCSIKNRPERVHSVYSPHGDRDNGRDSRRTWSGSSQS